MNELVVQIVAPIGRDAQLLSDFLRREGIEARIAHNEIGQMAPEERDRSGPLLIAEEALTPSLIGQLANLLGSQPFWSDLPILVLTTSGRETPEQVAKERQRLPLGHLTLLERPLRASSLLSAVEAALRARRRQYEVRDATDARDRANTALRASEEQNRLVLQSTRDWINLLGLEGEILSMNAEGRGRLGIPDSDRVEGKSWLGFWSDGDRPKARASLGAARENREGKFEGTYLTPGGDLTWWDVSVTPVHDQDGSIIHLLSVARDITDRKLAERALIQSEKLAAVGRLASSIAHEINNPLEAVTNLIYLALNRSTEQEVRQLLETADSELRRVSVIASQTLRFHKQASSPQAIRAADLFGSVLTIYEGRLKNSRIRVETDYRARHPVVCFEGDVRQVLSNLVGNAIDAMSEGGRLLLRSHEVKHRADRRQGLVLTVADTGTGMSAAIMAKIFEPFYTTKGIAGTGLGLWVCKEVAERHHGTLRVRSSQRAHASGSVFRFFLPYASQA